MNPIYPGDVNCSFSPWNYIEGFGRPRPNQIPALGEVGMLQNSQEVNGISDLASNDAGHLPWEADLAPLSPLFGNDVSSCKGLAITFAR
jgi:hypothetical protein